MLNIPIIPIKHPFKIQFPKYHQISIKYPVKNPSKSSHLPVSRVGPRIRLGALRQARPQGLRAAGTFRAAALRRGNRRQGARRLEINHERWRGCGYYGLRWWLIYGVHIVAMMVLVNIWLCFIYVHIMWLTMVLVNIWLCFIYGYLWYSYTVIMWTPSISRLAPNPGYCQISFVLHLHGAHGNDG